MSDETTPKDPTVPVCPVWSGEVKPQTREEFWESIKRGAELMHEQAGQLREPCFLVSRSEFERLKKLGWINEKGELIKR